VVSSVWLRALCGRILGAITGGVDGECDVDGGADCAGLDGGHRPDDGGAGDHAGAEAEYRDVLAARLPVLGPEHPDTLTTRHAVAYEMSTRGDQAGAEAEYRNVLADNVRVLGPDHPSTKATASWLPPPEP